MSDWETRMSEKAHERALERSRQELLEEIEQERLWRADNDATVDEYVEGLARDITYNQACEIDSISIACACIGPPRELWNLYNGAPCRCALFQLAARKVKEVWENS